VLRAEKKSSNLFQPLPVTLACIHRTGCDCRHGAQYVVTGLIHIIIIVVIVIVIIVIYCPTYYKPERPGITESIKNIILKSPRHVLKCRLVILEFGLGLESLESSFGGLRLGRLKNQVLCQVHTQTDNYLSWSQTR